MMKIEGKEGLVKDPQNQSVINTDDDAFRAAKQAKRRILESRKRESDMQERLEKLERVVEQLMENQNG
jgi:hypothetical protein